SVADACPIPLQYAFAEEFGVPLYTIWSASEVIGATTFGLEPGPVSRLQPGVQCRIVNEGANDVPHGAAVEPLIKAAMGSPGYWREDGLTPLAADGWYHTGDIMRRGEGDDLWFIGRKKELIIVGGANVAPVEVETVLRQHRAVADVAVVGLPSQDM